MLPTEYQAKPLTPEEEAALAAAMAGAGGGYEPAPAPAPLAPAGTAAPPTQTYAYPTAGPAGNTQGTSTVGYGEQIPAAAPVTYEAALPPTGSAGGGSAYYGGETSDPVAPTQPYNQPNMVQTYYPATDPGNADLRQVNPDASTGYSTREIPAFQSTPVATPANPTINTGNGSGVGNIGRPGDYAGSASAFGGGRGDPLTNPQAAENVALAAGRNWRENGGRASLEDRLLQAGQGVRGAIGAANDQINRIQIPTPTIPGVNLDWVPGSLQEVGSHLNPAIAVDVAEGALGLGDFNMIGTGGPKIGMGKGLRRYRATNPAETAVKETAQTPPAGVAAQEAAAANGRPAPRVPKWNEEIIVDAQGRATVAPPDAGMPSAPPVSPRPTRVQTTVPTQEATIIRPSPAKPVDAPPPAPRKPGYTNTRGTIGGTEARPDKAASLTKGLKATKQGEVVLPSEIPLDAFDPLITGRKIRNATNPVTNLVASAAERTPSWKTAAALSAIPAAIGVGKWGNEQLDKGGAWRDEVAMPAIQQGVTNLQGALPGANQTYLPTEPGMYRTPSNMGGTPEDVRTFRRLSDDYLEGYEPSDPVEQFAALTKPAQDAIMQGLRDRGIVTNPGWGLGPETTATVQGAVDAAGPATDAISQRLTEWGFPTPQDVINTAQQQVGAVTGQTAPATRTATPGGPGFIAPGGQRVGSTGGYDQLHSDDLERALTANPNATVQKAGVMYMPDAEGKPDLTKPMAFLEGDANTGKWQVRGSEVSLEEFWAEAEAAGRTPSGGAGGAGSQTIYDGFNDMPQTTPSIPSTASSGRGGGGGSTPSGPSGGGYTPRSSGGSYTPSGGGSTSTGSSRRGSSVGEMFDEDDDFGLNERDFTEKDYDGDGRISAKDRSVGRKRYQSELSKRRKKKGKTTSFSNVPQREDSPIRTKILSAIDQSVNKKKRR